MSAHTKDIWTEVINLLTASLVHGQPQADKQRTDIPALPAIVVLPVNEAEAEYSVPNFKRIIFTISLLCWIGSYNRATQVTGSVVSPEGVTKGIMDMSADLRNVINSNLNLNGKAIKLELSDTNYVYDEYPNQYAETLLKVEFITQYNTR